MTTLIETIDTSIGNWASQLNENLAYCGWMDLHKDEPYKGYRKGIWTIRVVEADRDAVFVHRKNGVFVIEELKPEQRISFRYDRCHGLLPREIGKALEGKRRWDKCLEYVEWMKTKMSNTYYRSIQTEQHKARLVWEFLL